MLLTSDFAKTCGVLLKKKRRVLLTEVYDDKHSFRLGFFSISGNTLVPCKITTYNHTFGYDRCEPSEVVEIFSRQHAFGKWEEFLQDLIDDACEFAFNELA